MREIHLFQLWVSPDTQFFHHQPLEMPRQKIGQVKHARLRFMSFQKSVGSPEKLITVGSGQSFHAFFGQYFVQLPACTAIRVSHEN